MAPKYSSFVHTYTEYHASNHQAGEYWGGKGTKLPNPELWSAENWNWKHVCFILSTGTRIRIDSVIRPRSSSRGRNTSASVTVTVTGAQTGLTTHPWVHKWQKCNTQCLQTVFQKFRSRPNSTERFKSTAKFCTGIPHNSWCRPDGAGWFSLGYNRSTNNITCMLKTKQHEYTVLYVWRFWCAMPIAQLHFWFIVIVYLTVTM